MVIKNPVTAVDVLKIQLTKTSADILFVKNDIRELEDNVKLIQEEIIKRHTDIEKYEEHMKNLNLAIDHLEKKAYEL